MRTLQLSLAGALILVIVGGSGAEAAVRSLEPTAAVSVSGRLALSDENPGGSGTLDEYALEWRGLSVPGRMTMSDARLSGEARVTWNADMYRPHYMVQTSGGIVAGRLMVDNEAGSWEGTLRGVVWPEWDGLRHQVRLVGSGAYEGLRALLYLSSSAYDEDMTVKGLIFPGEPPPLPELPAE